AGGLGSHIRRLRGAGNGGVGWPFVSTRGGGKGGGRWKKQGPTFSLPGFGPSRPANLAPPRAMQWSRHQTHSEDWSRRVRSAARQNAAPKLAGLFVPGRGHGFRIFVRPETPLGKRPQAHAAGGDARLSAPVRSRAALSL